MAGEEIGFIFLIAIFIIVALILFNNKLGTRKMYLDKLKSAGYSVSSDYLADLERASSKSGIALRMHPFISKWSISKKDISFNVQLTQTGSGKYTKYWFDIEFKMPQEIRENLKLKIERRGFFSRLFGLNRGQYHGINDKFTVIGSNIMLVKHLLNNPSNLRQLREATFYGVAFDLNGKSTARVPRDIDTLIRACNETIDVVNVFRDFVLEIKGEKQYSIQEILVDFNADLADLTCIICYQAVKIEEALIFNCCSAIGHENHLKNWLKEKSMCPYCRKTNFSLLEPITADIKVR